MNLQATQQKVGRLLLSRKIFLGNSRASMAICSETKDIGLFGLHVYSYARRRLWIRNLTDFYSVIIAQL